MSLCTCAIQSYVLSIFAPMRWFKCVSSLRNPVLFMSFYLCTHLKMSFYLHIYALFLLLSLLSSSVHHWMIFLFCPSNFFNFIQTCPHFAICSLFSLVQFSVIRELSMTMCAFEAVSAPVAPLCLRVRNLCLCICVFLYVDVCIY